MAKNEHNAAWQREYRLRNGDDIRRKSREYYARNRERMRERNGVYYHANRDRIRFNNLWSKRRIRKDEFDKILKRQRYCCAICKEPFKDYVSSPHVDHCHNHGHVRGLLCAFCNHAIGYLRNSSKVAVAAAAYLQKEELFNAQTQ